MSEAFDPARFDDGDEPLCNPRADEPLASLPELALRRRRLLQGGLGVAMASVVGWPRGEETEPSAADEGLLGFHPVPVSADDRVIVPEGYEVQVLLPWGEPVQGDHPPFDARDASNSAEEQVRQLGMHHDGMHFFPDLDPSGRPRSDAGLLVINHESVDWLFLHPRGPTLQIPRPGEEVAKEQAAHGLSVIALRCDESGQWRRVNSPMNRRITANTPVVFSGPVAGSPWLRTLYSPDGLRGRGTLANCSGGATPWGTYLTCEENWAGYFANSDQRPPRQHQRYGVRNQPGPLGFYSKLGWHAVSAEQDPERRARRFDASTRTSDAGEDFRNEPNQFGWIVEIDPRDPESTPVKRTAMGRFAHEGVIFQPAREGHCVVAYSGDDAVFEYIYKYVSRDPWDPATSNGSLLDHGTLYVARFEADGRGRWLPLVHGRNGLTPANGFRDQADVLVNTRAAADRLGATPMDRPEWGAVHPQSREVYFTLTNNSAREPQGADRANPRGPNPFGHIIRWREDRPLPRPGELAAAFQWDLFALGGDEHSGSVQGQALTADNRFSSPDGLWFDPDGRLWIETDLSQRVLLQGPFRSFGNNQLLCADPRRADLRRFLTGPVGQEITGITGTPDQRTVFVNVQHPGQSTTSEQFLAGQYTSNWPGGEGTRPRSATLAIRRSDGGKVGT